MLDGLGLQVKTCVKRLAKPIPCPNKCGLKFTGSYDRVRDIEFEVQHTDSACYHHDGSRPRFRKRAHHRTSMYFQLVILALNFCNRKFAAFTVTIHYTALFFDAGG